MSFREADPDEPDALELVRGTNIVFEALRAGGIDAGLVPNILVRCLCFDIQAAGRRRKIDHKIAQIDEMAAYMRAAISADHMVAEFFGSER